MPRHRGHIARPRATDDRQRTVHRLLTTVSLAILAAAASARAAGPIAEPWDYAPAMRQVAARGKGRAGVVLHIGDSLTYSNPYGQWARLGAGKTDVDKQALACMHTGADDDRDGWWLCRFDHPDGGRSHTAAGGLRLDELLAGGKQGLPSLAELLDRYRPQAVVLMIGSNDASVGRDRKQFHEQLVAAVSLALDRGVVCVLSTIPPHPRNPELAKHYNESVREVARGRNLPLIDLEREILARRPNDFNGTLLEKDDVHLSAVRGELNSASEPTDENLRQIGYLLRGWLSVRKLAEVKRRVFDGLDNHAATNQPPKPAHKAVARGETVRLNITRDTWFSEVGKEADGNTGGSDRLKVKSIQEMSLVDFDPAPLRGRLVRSAQLHVRLRGPEILRRMTVGSFSAEWVEGTASGYEAQPGSSCFNWRKYPDVPWAYRGSDLSEVIFGRGGSRWRTTDASPPGEGGWQTIAVAPDVLAARVAGCSYGLFVFDDTGSEWTCQGEQFKPWLFPNRFFHSRESRERSAPYLTVELGERDDEPPEAPTDLSIETKGLPPGEAKVSWSMPKDRGPGQTIGFHVLLDGKPLPRYLIPIASAAGERVTMHLRDVPVAGGAELEVRAVDSAGNEGPPAKLRVKPACPAEALSPPLEVPRERVMAFNAFLGASSLPTLAGVKIAVIDPLDKVDLDSGKIVPEQPAIYLASNHLWDAETREIHLQAAKNEFVGFQLVVKGGLHGLAIATWLPDNQATFDIQWGRLFPLRVGKGEFTDPVLPLENLAANQRAGFETESGFRNGNLVGERGGALLCEIHVPHDSPAGEYAGYVLLSKRQGGVRLQLHLKLHLTVWDFTLPDYLSFLPEMNCYGLPENERDYYRLAHEHRTFLNRLPYHQNGAIADGCAPKWDGKRLEWDAWDTRFGQYLDGSAFADLPRRGVPVDGFYLPWHENWPSPMEGNYNGDYWADRAFPESYRQALVEVARQLAEHIDRRGWHDTLFQGFLNNKNNFKERGWSRGSSPWLLDEPANFQDYWALRWFGQAFHEGADAARGKASVLFRCDISRPQWQRDLFDDVLDYNVVGGAMRRYRRMVLDRKKATGQVVIEYGSANALERSNVQPAAWCIDAWSLGADGVLPWQTIGTDQSWRQADTLALFYPGKPAGYDQPVPSLRLKAFRRGQQDVEYLTLYSQLKGVPRWQIGRQVREWLGLSGQRRASGVPAAEDAGVIDYGNLLPQNLWALRTGIGKELSAAHPPAKRRLVEFKVPARPLRPMSEFVVEGP
ncbi:MAG TPA: GDSL-type esterase/lipase family protein [Pirellulales bacterium]|nr:GDSL-type esterase/lipase family protein [Pirellulales bacterium]